MLTPNAYLDVEMKPIQQRLLDPKPTDFMMYAIAKTVTGEGAKQSMAKRKLDALGNVRAHCGAANDPKRMKRLREQLALADSVSEISKLTQVWVPLPNRPRSCHALAPSLSPPHVLHLPACHYIAFTALRFAAPRTRRTRRQRRRPRTRPS